MAYKHLIQKDIPFVTYPLDKQSSNGTFEAYSIYTSQSASILNQSDTFSTANTIPFYEVPLVNGNNISNYLGGTASAYKIKTPGFFTFTEKNRYKDHCVEFWTRLSPADVSGSAKWLMRTGYSFENSLLPMGIFIKDQHIIFNYGHGATSYKSVSLPIDKFNQPLHIVAGVTKSSMFLSCNGIKVSESFATVPILSSYNSSKDYLVFGDSYTSIEISCISIYDYCLLDEQIYQHYVKGQGYSIPPNYYKDLDGYIYSMNLSSDQLKYYPVNNTVLSANSYNEWNNLFNAKAIFATSGIKISNTSNSIFLSSEKKNFQDEFLRLATGTYSTLANSSASGMSIQKGKSVQISPVNKYSLDSTDSFWIESTLSSSTVFPVGASATVYYLYSDNIYGNVWVYQERIDASKNRTKYVISDYSGNESASGYLSGSISSGEIFAVGAVKYSDGIYLYQKTGNPLTITGSYSFGISADSAYSFLASINGLRIGSKVDVKNVEYSSITGDNSYGGYLQSIKWGYPYAFVNNDDTLQYNLIQYDHADGQKMKWGVYNEKISTEKIPLLNIASRDSSGNYYIYRNRLDFSFPDQENISTKSDAVKIYLNSYTNNVLTSSVRILSSSQAVIYPASYTSISPISSSAISFDILFNTNDIEKNAPHISYFKFYGLLSSSLTVNTGTPNISLFSNKNNSIGMLPPAKLTPFINNSIEDSGLLLSGSANYAEIPFSFSTSSIRNISLYIYAPTPASGSLTAPVFSINNNPILTITNAGASININTSSVSKIYINGASLTPTSGSVAFYKDRWVSVGIVLTNPISNSSGSVITIGSKSVDSFPYFIDELAFFGKAMTDDDFKKLYNLQVSGTASTVSIVKDGASPTVDMTKTYGSSSSAKVMLAFMDKETSASTVGNSDMVQLFTNEGGAGSVNYVAALRTSSVVLNTALNDQSNIFVDGYLLKHGDKVLVYDGDIAPESYTFNTWSNTTPAGQNYIIISLANDTEVANFNKMVNSLNSLTPKSWQISFPLYPSITGIYLSSYVKPDLAKGISLVNIVFLATQAINDLINLSGSVAGNSQIKFTSGKDLTAGVYSASVSTSGSVRYLSSGSVALNEKQVFYISEGQQYGDIYCSIDRVSSNLKLNIFEDRYKIKYVRPSQK